MTAIDKKPTDAAVTAGATENQMPTVIEAMLFSARRWHDAQSHLREKPPAKPSTLSYGATVDAAGQDLKFG